MKDIKAYIDKNKDRFLEELFGLIEIPSISSLLLEKDDIRSRSRQGGNHAYSR